MRNPKEPLKLKNPCAVWAGSAHQSVVTNPWSQKGSAILILGVAYKKDTGDLRESPALDIIHLLQEKGAVVYYHDPHVPAFDHDGLTLTCIP